MAFRLRGLQTLKKVSRVNPKLLWQTGVKPETEIFGPIRIERSGAVGIERQPWIRAFYSSSAKFDSSFHVGSGSGGRVGGVAVRGPPEDFPFAVKGLNHIAVAVPNLKEASEHYRTVFGAHVSEPLDQPLHGVTVVFVQLANFCIELLQPLGDNSPIAKFLEKNPKGGMHHLCLTVDNIEAAMCHVKEHGMQILSPLPKMGAHHHPVIFLNPKTNHGVLCELEEIRTHYEAEKDEVEEKNVA